MYSDRFFELPMRSQMYYVYLTLRADDDGLYGGKKSLLHFLDMTEKDFTPLVEAGLVHEFPSGILAVMHFKLYNQIKKDRYTSTIYVEEMAQLDFVPGIGYVLKKEAPQPQTEEIAPEKAAAQPQTTAMPLRDGTEYTPTPEEIAEYQTLYPDVDVDQQLRNMRGWLLANPKKQKTKDGIRRFIGAWLLNAQNKSLRPGVGTPFEQSVLGERQSKKASFKEGPASYDLLAAQRKMDTTVPTLKKRQR